MHDFKYVNLKMLSLVRVITIVLCVDLKNVTLAVEEACSKNINSLQNVIQIMVVSVPLKLQSSYLSSGTLLKDSMNSSSTVTFRIQGMRSTSAMRIQGNSERQMER